MSSGSWEVSLVLISQVKSGQWWGSGSSSLPSKRILGKTTENLQLLVILLQGGDKSFTSLVLGWDGWWSWDVVTLCSELGLAQSP